VLRALIAEDIEVIFGYPGGAIMPIYDALYDYESKLKHILVRHEQVQFMQPRVLRAPQEQSESCLRQVDRRNESRYGSCRCNDRFNTRVHYRQVYAHLLGTDAFQETDVINITTRLPNGIIKSQMLLKFYCSCKSVLHSGSGRRTVVIDITKNAQLQKFDFQGYTKCDHIRSYRPKPIVRKKYLEQAAALIKEAERPFVILGKVSFLAERKTNSGNLLKKRCPCSMYDSWLECVAV
jgi:acetolactate synthase-1/2/3 large subunit